MNDVKNQRLRLVVTQLELLKVVKNDSDFAAQIGWNRTGLSSTYSGKRAVSDDLIRDICRTFEFVNPKYLTGEESTMLLEYPDLYAGNFLICEEEDVDDVIGGDDEKVEALEKRVDELEKIISAKDSEIAWLRSLVEKLTAK